MNAGKHFSQHINTIFCVRPDACRIFYISKFEFKLWYCNDFQFRHRFWMAAVDIWNFVNVFSSRQLILWMISIGEVMEVESQKVTKNLKCSHVDMVDILQVGIGRTLWQLVRTWEVNVTLTNSFERSLNWNQMHCDRDLTFIEKQKIKKYI